MNRSVVLLSTGLWAGLLIVSWVIASTTFRTADSVLRIRPEIADRLSGVPEPDLRSAFRLVAAEINRRMFGARGAAELGLALLVLVLVPGGSPRVAAGVLLALSLVEWAWLSPAMAQLGRGLDLLPRPLPPDIAKRFGMLHGAYLLADLIKGGTLGWLGWTTIRTG